METEVLSGSINEFSCSSKVSLPHHSKSNQIIYAGKDMTELIIISNKTKMITGNFYKSYKISSSILAG